MLALKIFSLSIPNLRHYRGKWWVLIFNLEWQIYREFGLPCEGLVWISMALISGHEPKKGHLFMSSYECPLRKIPILSIYALCKPILHHTKRDPFASWVKPILHHTKRNPICILSVSFYFSLHLLYLWLILCSFNGPSMKNKKLASSYHFKG